MGHRGLRGAWYWDHNAWYHPVLLRRLPRRLGSVLDVGCGSGLLASALTRRADRVTAIDPDPVMSALARAEAPCATVIAGDFLTADLPGGYDAIVSVSALHHMPLDAALRRVDDLLAPGGAFVAIGIPRSRLPRELPVEAAAFVAQRVLAVALLAARLVTGRPWLARRAEDAAMPTVWPPPHSVADVRRIATAALPESSVRRLLFWRYLLVWRKPLVPRL